LKDSLKEIQPTLTPHRLDTDTTGLLIVAKTKKAYEHWRTLFREKKVRKKYSAWCWGHPKEDSFEITYPIAHATMDRRKMTAIMNSVTRHIPPIQQARSFVTVLEKFQNRFLCEVVSYSGITHQVRIHLASMGFPIIGDHLYDPQFKSRNLRPKHHQLRAVEITTANFEAMAYKKPFLAESKLPA
jgi:23S rRNA pseudouridine1911/1915/1917 synthase